jgi:carboxypeptidase C (cathepsin A)
MTNCRLNWLGLTFSLLLAIASAAAAQEQSAKVQARQNAPKTGVLALLPEDSVTEQSLALGDGRQLAYRATAGTLDLFDQNGERSAELYYTAYVLKDAAAERPVTFVFNGGPGAASAFLHLGLVGPKVLDFGPSGHDGARARLVSNPRSWLEFTDLVLIDPVGTGWSRAARRQSSEKFWGVDRDAESLAKAVALYIAENGRSGSPKYLLGESYGGFRAVKLARALQEDQGIIINGIVMVSPLLEGPLMFRADRFALGAALRLPSLAAAELERQGALTPDAIAEAERFALTDYLTTLAGPPPQGEAGRTFYGRVAELTGLPLQVIERSRGFIRDTYAKQARDGAPVVVSAYDAGYVVPDPYPESRSERGPDPVLDGFVRAYGGAFAAYARDELGFKTEMTYKLLAGEVSGRWEWGHERSLAQASVDDDLRELLALNRSLRVLVAHGTSDLVTPYSVSRYVIDHLPAGLAERVELKLYRGGHMAYTIPETRIAMTADAKGFYGAATQ